MTGSESIDLSLENIWRSWFLFRRGKTKNSEFHNFQFHLEENLYELYQKLNNGSYSHGGYRTFIVQENKRRLISVAPVSDRVVHRLVYEYLVKIYDKKFIYDAWSCRKGKGLHSAIERSKLFLSKSKHQFVWRSDIHRFFDSVNHEILLKILSRTISCRKTMALMQEIINKSNMSKIGIPIGNLTSQVFANIYLNELDHFIKNTLKIKFYLRYGDDFIVISKSLCKLQKIRLQTILFLSENLSLNYNSKNDFIVKVSSGIKFLGSKIWPKYSQISTRNQKRIYKKINIQNIPSYSGIASKTTFRWLILPLLMPQSSL